MIDKRRFPQPASYNVQSVNCRKPGIYFVQAEDGGLIKIGWSIDCEHRLRDMQIGSPVRLKLLVIVPGNRKRERQLHQHWAHLRAHGEWFRPAPELLESIAHSQRLMDAVLMP